MNFYFEAAGVLDRLEEKKGSIKGLLSSLPAQNRKRVTALVLQTLKYKPTLNEVVDAVKFLHLEKRAFPPAARNTALVLLHDMLFTKGGIQAGDGPLKQAVLRHKTRLHAELTRVKIKRGARTNEDLIQLADPRAAAIPRYVRVNTLKTSFDDAVSDLATRNFVLAEGDEPHGRDFVRDMHVPDLLAFEARTTEMNSDPAYVRGELVLQDKASCFPPLVLAPPAHERAKVIDATAAPGNKTTYLAALMRGLGTLYAFERDKRRFGTLEMMLARAGASNVVARNADFLSIDPNADDYRDVTHILLDPSCSGSGIVNRLDYLLDDAEEEQEELEERLEKLSAFQQSMIAHAMTFPKVQRIVYSTCSIHAAENERVVHASLLAAKSEWVLAPRAEVLPTWQRRGIQKELGDDIGDAESLIRCMPGEDKTNGFFVACFVRAPKSRKRKADGNPDQEPSAEKRKKKKKKKKTATQQKNKEADSD